MRVCIFEDNKFDNLYPLTYLRPVFELRCGNTTLFEKIKRKFPKEEVSFFMRECLVKVFKNKIGNAKINDFEGLKDDCLFINGRILLIDSKLQLDGPEEIGVCSGDIVYARIKKETAESIIYKGTAPESGTLCGHPKGRVSQKLEEFLDIIKQKIPNTEVSEKLINYPWDLVSNNGKAIKDDFNFIVGNKIEGVFSPQAAIWGSREKVYIAKSAEVQPFVVLDTTHGPIIIDEKAKIYPFSRIEGPASIGKDSQILGAKIREGTSIGPVCRVGGEVEESIIHGFSNKYHDGFLGHAYLCEWVNIGALGTNSDLKNDYSQVQVYVKGVLRDSNETKVGSFIGDHTKTSIGTFLNTGSVVGIMCNLVGSGGVLPKHIPSFIWFLNNRAYKGYGFRMMVETAKEAVSRRNVGMTEDDIDLLKYVYELTKEERNEMIAKGRVSG